MLDKRLEILGTLYDKQYKLLKGVLESDNKKLKKINDKEIDDNHIIYLLILLFCLVSSCGVTVVPMVLLQHSATDNKAKNN